jgi:hypothetical protein
MMRGWSDYLDDPWRAAVFQERAAIDQLAIARGGRRTPLTGAMNSSLSASRQSIRQHYGIDLSGRWHLSGIQPGELPFWRRLLRQALRQPRVACASGQRRSTRHPRSRTSTKRAIPQSPKRRNSVCYCQRLPFCRAAYQPAPQISKPARLQRLTAISLESLHRT